MANKVSFLEGQMLLVRAGLLGFRAELLPAQLGDHALQPGKCLLRPGTSCFRCHQAGLGSTAGRLGSDAGSVRCSAGRLGRGKLPLEFRHPGCADRFAGSHGRSIPPQPWEGGAKRGPRVILSRLSSPLGARPPLRPNRTPVNAFEQGRELRR